MRVNVLRDSVSTLPKAGRTAGLARELETEIAAENENFERLDLERELAQRHPDRFVPRYGMVTFRRLPYATAFERGRIQRALLVEATQGRASLDGIDRAWLDAEVQRRLPPLPVEG